MDRDFWDSAIGSHESFIMAAVAFANAELIISILAVTIINKGHIVRICLQLISALPQSPSF